MVELDFDTLFAEALAANKVTGDGTADPPTPDVMDADAFLREFLRTEDELAASDTCANAASSVPFSELPSPPPSSQPELDEPNSTPPALPTSSVVPTIPQLPMPVAYPIIPPFSPAPLFGLFPAMPMLPATYRFASSPTLDSDLSEVARETQELLDARPHRRKRRRTVTPTPSNGSSASSGDESSSKHHRDSASPPLPIHPVSPVSPNAPLVEASTIKSMSDLTPEERKRIRMMKNRLSATQSRQRARQHVDQLEAKAADLIEENARLHAELRATRAENAQLRETLRLVSETLDMYQAGMPQQSASAVPLTVKSFGAVCAIAALGMAWLLPSWSPSAPHMLLRAPSTALALSTPRALQLAAPAGALALPPGAASLSTHVKMRELASGSLDPYSPFTLDGIPELDGLSPFAQIDGKVPSVAVALRSTATGVQGYVVPSHQEHS